MEEKIALIVAMQTAVDHSFNSLLLPSLLLRLICPLHNWGEPKQATCTYLIVYTKKITVTVNMYVCMCICMLYMLVIKFNPYNWKKL